jgi:hypothetical protein
VGGVDEGKGRRRAENGAAGWTVLPLRSPPVRWVSWKKIALGCKVSATLIYFNI